MQGNEAGARRVLEAFAARQISLNQLPLDHQPGYQQYQLVDIIQDRASHDDLRPLITLLFLVSA